jgi:hypothetical protein
MWGGVRWFPAIWLALVSSTVFCSGYGGGGGGTGGPACPFSTRLFAGAVDGLSECHANPWLVDAAFFAQ